MATLLEIVQDACDGLSLARPSAVIGSNDQQVRTLLWAANREGHDLMRAANWTVLQRLHTVTTVASQAEYALPTDFDRLLIDTEWDRSNSLPWIGPVSPQGWQTIKSGGIGSGLAGSRYRIYRGSTGIDRKVYVDPTPSENGVTLVFEYISMNWCANAGGDTTYSSWNADTDVPLLDDELMRLGIILRFRRSRGLEFASEAQEYRDLLMQKMGQDRPARALSLARRRTSYLLGNRNIPETGYGV